MPASPLLTVEDLAKYLHKSVTTIRSDVSRNPQCLPPICRLPGTKRLLWRLEDVERWLAGYVMDPFPLGIEGKGGAFSAVRGRPTKAQQVAAQRKHVRTSEQLEAQRPRGAK
ncbi:hypothetical protein DBR00_07250 [Pseudomonas sp. HMWF032]|nr:hypothetical protein DBR00_07250 [Pseudomonas sp. HMWF032]PTT84594.1 hypothetical protein DBR41_07030 [Pseudomonas sp. HMWF010]